MNQLQLSQLQHYNASNITVLIQQWPHIMTQQTICLQNTALI